MSSLLQLLPRPPRLRKGTFYVQTWGCQMNEEDSEQMALYMREIGFEPAASILDAHVVLLNTCSVRKKPEDKAFSLLGEIAEMKQARPEMVVGVCGCMAQIRAEEIRKRAPHVDFVVGTGQVGAIPGLVEQALQTRKFQSRLDLPERRGAVVEEMPNRHVGREPKLKAFIPIQYGCDKFCTFCIVPTTRGRERSRPTAHILEEAQSLVRQGTKEITLLGQTVNSYGKNMPEGRVSFAELLWLLNRIDGLQRIRYTSPYPRDFKQDLIETIRDCPTVMEHCHMPLQGGLDSLLQRMKRLYTVEGFTKIVRELRRVVPGIAITTDIIVGFPGETEAEFEGTMSVVEELRFDGAYMFAYSPRPGTPAAEMDQVPADVKKARLNHLIQTQNRISMEVNESLVGKTFEVLVEGRSPKQPGRLQGYSREFKMMHFDGPPELRSEIVNVRAIQAHQWGLAGKLE